jgi:chromosome segregation ATPase
MGLGEIMNSAMDKNVRQTRFQIAELQKRIAVLEATREDLERQIRKLNDSVPEDMVEASAQKDGYVAYGSYAQSVIARKDNIRSSLTDIQVQTADLAGDLRIALDALDSFERVKARQMAAKAEKAMQKRA